jgi:hypothetical protein
MSPTVKMHMIEDVQWRERAGVVEEVQRGALVYGLTPNGGNPEMLVANALAVAGVPEFGDAHPIYSGLYLAERRPRVLDPTVVQIMLVYRLASGGIINEPPPGFAAAIRGGTALEQETTMVDRNGDQILVPWTHPGSGMTRYHSGQVPALRPRDYLSFTNTLQSASPGTLSRQYVGAVNDDTWNGLPAGGWLCQGMEFELIDRSTTPPTWRYVYSFRANAKGWQPDVVFIDPHTNNPPAGISIGNGIVADVLLYDEEDFDALSLV